MKKLTTVLLKILDLIGAILINWILGFIVLFFINIISVLVFVLGGLKGLLVFYETLPGEIKKQINKDEKLPME